MLFPARSPYLRNRPRRNLRLRADALRTFGPLLAPVALGLVALGFYLLGSAVAHPLSANSSQLLSAALILSLGFVLLSYLLRAAVTAAPHRTGTPLRRASPMHSARTQVLPPPGVPPDSDVQPASSLPFHRMYVDRARVQR
jgi:hypothetical protein